MAVINSASIGKGVKSQGNLTYRFTRGRCIASSRITQNKSNTPAQATQRASFKDYSKAVARLAGFINLAFDKSKYGSSRNHFMTLNKIMTDNVDLLKEFADGFTSIFKFADSCFQPDLTNFWPVVAKGAAPVQVAYSYLATDGNRCDSMTIEFPSGVLPTDLSFGGYMIKDNGAVLASPVPIKNLTPSDEFSENPTKYILNDYVILDLVYNSDKTLIMSATIALSSIGDDFAERPNAGYFLPIARVKLNNCTITAPLYQAKTGA